MTKLASWQLSVSSDDQKSNVNNILKIQILVIKCGNITYALMIKHIQRYNLLCVAAVLEDRRLYQKCVCRRERRRRRAGHRASRGPHLGIQHGPDSLAVSVLLINWRPEATWQLGENLFETSHYSSLSGVPDYFDRNKILSGYDLSHYQVPHCIKSFLLFCLICVYSSQFSILFWIMYLL